MGRRQTGSVFSRGDTIRCQFQWQGERVSETLHGLSALKPRDMAIAQRTVADIVAKIAHGTFDYAATFPDSPRAVVQVTGIRTLSDALDSYLESAKTKAARTLAQYTNAAQEWREILGGNLVLSSAKPSDIRSKIFGVDWSSPARFNNALIPLRGAINAARRDNPELPDLLGGVDNMGKNGGDPDPLGPSDTALVLAHIRQKYGDRPWAWVAFAFATGLRPSEQCALLHSDIVAGDRANVTKALDLDGSVKATKTGGKRLVDLAPLAIDAVNVSKSFSNTGGEIFQNPWSGLPWHGNRSQHENIWVPTLKALNITPRRAYCTRHTFATTLLAHGARVAYVSSQMGHTSPSMVEKTYARWLPDGDGGFSRAILAGAFA